MTIPNYLALYNLSQIEADILIVSDLTATTGTIYTLNSTIGTITTLNSTTGNITTLNSTTANITTLLTDLWKGTTTSSSMVIGVNGDSGTLTSWRDLIMSSGKKITLNSTGGKVLSNIYTGTTPSSSMSLGEFGDTSNITFYKNINMGSTRFITIQSDGTLYVNTITATDSSVNATLFSNHTGNINLGYTFSINPINLNCNTILAVNKTLSLSGTGKITTPDILVSNLVSSKMVLTDASKNLVSSSYTDSDFTRLAASNIFTGATNTFNNKILCNTYTGLTASSAISIGESGDTSVVNIYKSITMASAKNISLSGGGSISVSTTGIISCYQYQSTSPVQFLSLGSTNTTSGIYIGEGQTSGGCFIGNTTPANDIGLLTVNKNTTINSTKILRATKISGDTVSGDITFGDSTSDTGYIYSNRNIAINGGKNLYINDAGGDIYCDNYNSYNGANNINLLQNVVLSANKNLTLQGTGEFITSISGDVRTNYLYGISATDVVRIYDNTTSGDIYLGNSLTSGNIYIGLLSTSGTILPRMSMTFGANKNITLQGTGEFITSISGDVRTNYLYGISATDVVRIYDNTTSGDIYLGNSLTSGNIYIGLLSTSGTILSRMSMTFGTGKDLTLSTTSSIFTDLIKGTSATTSPAIFSTTTSGSLNIGGALTSGNINLGLIGMTGKISCNANVEIGTSAVNKGLSCNYFQSFNVGDLMRYSATSTTGSIRIGENQTSGGVQIGNSTASSDTGSVQCNKNLIMGGAVGLNQKSISSNYYNGLSTTSGVAIASTNTSGVITIGESSSITPFTGGTFNNSFFGVRRWLGVSQKYAYTNVGYGDATTPTLFKGFPLTGKYLTSTMWASAASSEWCSFESDTANEGSAFIQNGDTSCIINPGDQFTLWWLDTDTIIASAAGSTTYNWSGWKISTAGVFTLSSDRRLKRDITPIIDNNILDKLSKIEIVNYKWKAPSEEKYYKNGVLRRKYQEIHTGYIAQDVRKIFPECVDRETDDAYWTIKREDITSKFNLGVQELIKQNKQQQAQIDDLTTRLARLEQLLIPPV